MKKFEFSTKQDTSKSIFSGPEFYHVYKEAHFLKHPNNIETILSKGYELRQMLKKVLPGEVVALEKMYLYDDTVLIVKKTGPNIEVKNHEFTANRLSGLVAAYAFDNRSKFNSIKSSEAETLGLKWDNATSNKCRLYLSAVSGTEHFYEQFHFWPLVCAIRKLQLNKITIEPVVKMAKIKNPKGIRMAEDFIKNLGIVKKLWLAFPNTSPSELIPFIMSTPQLCKLFGGSI